MTTAPESVLIAAAERGRLDVATVAQTATAAQLAALRTRVGSRLRSAPAGFTQYASLNVRNPPFDDERVRRALNLAVDRRRVMALSGGRDAAAPTCQILPPGLPGYRAICPFTALPSAAGGWTATDRAQARRVAASGNRGATVELQAWSAWSGVARHLAGVLRELGFRVRARTFDEFPELMIAALHRPRAEIAINGWFADSPDPGMFLRSIVACGAQFNLSRFCDRGIDAAIDRAQAAGAQAGGAWQQIERRIAKRAPVVALWTRRWVVVTSKRAGNVQYHPVYHELFDQVWVR